MLLIFHFHYEVLVDNGLNEVIFQDDHGMAMCGRNTSMMEQLAGNEKRPFW